MSYYAVVLAAGKGSRMKSLNEEISKVSYPILGKPLVRYVIDALLPLKLDKIVTVVGHGGAVTVSHVEKFSETVWQKELKGTGHAVMQTEPVLGGLSGTTLVVTGDTPLLRTETLKALLAFHAEGKYDLSVLTAEVGNPFGYGRILKDEKGLVAAIIEQPDLISGQEKIKEINTGVLVFDNQKLFAELKNLKPNIRKGEYYLTDLIAAFRQKGFKVGAYKIGDYSETLGINDRVQLEEAARILKIRINKKHMYNGVTVEDIENTYIGPDVTIGPDTVIRPGTAILGVTAIGNTNVIGPESYIVDSQIGNNNHVIKSYIVESTIGDDSEVGPYTHLRGHTVLEGHNRVGNFVEVKKTVLHQGVKSAHLSYLGDAEIGSKTNIGCGTIIANYDGKNKWNTKIGQNVFVGSGSTIISPVNIEDDAFIAAGSTINKDVGKDDLAIARARQENKKGYAAILKERISNRKK